MKIICFSKRKLNVHKISIFTNLQPFNFNLQQYLKIAALFFGENPEKKWSKFSKNSAKFWQNLQHLKLHFVKNQKFQQILTKKMRSENGAKECIV